MPYKNPADAAKRDAEYRKEQREKFEKSPEGKLAAQLRRTKEQRKEELRRASTMDLPLAVPATTLKVKMPRHGLKIAYVPDTQVKPSVPIDHIVHAGKYIARKRPDVIVCAMDWWDMESCSDHDKPGSLDAEGKRYKECIAVGCDAMEQFLEPIAAESDYDPLLVATLGNHEYRIVRAKINDPRRFTGSLRDLRLEEYGWKVYPFLQPVVIGGVAFCHYFPSGKMDRPITTAEGLLGKMHMSCVAGHQQGRDVHYERRADGKSMTGIISGSFYQHNEKYMSPLANKHWRGMWMLHEVKDGQFDEMPVSINFLKRKFG